MEFHARIADALPAVCRLGLATRGNTRPTCDDVWLALERGVNYWNWCGHLDGMSAAAAQLGPRRGDVVLAVQLGPDDWGRDAMRREIDAALAELRTDYLDVVTLYYVESRGDWDRIVSRGGALDALRSAKEQGTVRCIGLTSHQRPLAAEWARSGLLDLLMVRYNAAHRGAETDVFPVTDRLRLPVVAFTCLRWGGLLKPTPRDPEEFAVPPAPEWYRFVLSHPSVSVALTAPNDRNELLANLALLRDWRPVSDVERRRLSAHGERVRATAGPFP
jgi:predicted aldo/keto reductase-like oxidoreductase